MLRPLILSLALASGVLAGTPAVAAAGASTAKVSYGDLDLASAKGVRAFERRLDGALRHVCDYDSRERQIARKKAARRCMIETRAKLVLPDAVASRLAAR